MVGFVDLDLTTGKGLTIAVFVAIVALLVIVAGGWAVILGATIAGVALLLVYYLSVRAHRFLSGKGGRPR